MCASGDRGLDHALLSLLVVLCALAAGARGSLPKDMGVTDEDEGRSPAPTTHDADRGAPVVTTAPTFNIPNHHPLLKGFLLPGALLTRDFRGQQRFFEEGRAMDGHPEMLASSSHLAEEVPTHVIPHEDAPAFSSFADTAATTATTEGVTRPTVKAATISPELSVTVAARTPSSSITRVSLASAAPARSNSPSPTTTMGRRLSTREEVTSATTFAPLGLTTAVGVAPQRTATSSGSTSKEITATTTASSGETDEETTTTTIITTTVITTMQTPVPCSTNFTAPEGYIEAPQQANPWPSSMDCTYSVTVYMGYGVELQVLNVSLSEGEMVTLEDLGGRGPSLLANESILMKGLVVRSWSNHVTIRFQSEQQLRPGFFLLRYQAFVLSCPFPQRPAYGEVSVTSLHAGGEAYFYCISGYQLQGLSTLTCRNATTPYWSGREPRCLAACGGMVKHATVGRIVSPGFPSNYSNNLTCHWVLEAPEGHRLHVHFEKVALAEDDDRLLIKNGNNIDSPPLYDSYEVEYLPNEGIVSTSRHLFVELTTDGSGTSTGIAIRYEAFAQGHCYEPFVKYGNFTSSESGFTVGAVVEFACEPGYTLEQGSVIIECMDPENPQWNETEPACRAVCSGEITDSAGVVLSPNWPEAYDRGQDCIWGIHVEEDKRIMLDIQVLHVGKNDVLTFYDGDDLTAKILGQYAGSRPRFKLFTSMADVTIQFQSDPATNIFGYHNGFVIHFFEVPRNDTCPELPEITNGWKSTSHPELVHGTVITYQCYPGFELVGTEILMCQWDLTWSGDLPSCEKVLSCPDPGSVEHSRRVMSGHRLTVGSTVQYVCNRGYMLTGNSLLTCHNRDSRGPKWSERPPKCVPESYEPCRHPGAPPFSIQSQEKHSYQPGETLRFSCQSGYQLQGEPALRCTAGHPSQWSHPPPVCHASTMGYVSERRLDVANADFNIEGTGIAVAVFIPVAIILALIVGIYLYFSKVQGKPFLLPMSTALPYDHIAADSAFDNPIYETANSEETREYEVSI
ncbi:seizure protein 6 isoform X2 [Scleropages formosus]|uniref:seizure protein 6 isoform X2 n=1 Tax=Scleropages formosus TaxID=113540 RepID=UPI0010FA8DBA|nr:seizure protein 6 homolog isoform X2 [Scleropages formosus]